MPFSTTTVNIIDYDKDKIIISLDCNNNAFTFQYLKDDLITINSETYKVKFRRWDIGENYQTLYIYVYFYTMNWRQLLSDLDLRR